jgi:uroporphyrinogen-III synthase
MKSSIFITKEIDAHSDLKQWCFENKIKLVSKSFLTFEPITSSDIPKEEVYFFTSKRAVSYFISQFQLPDEVKIACVGQATANECIKNNINIDFIGQASGNPVLVAEELDHYLGNQSIVFIGALEGSDAIYNELVTLNKSKFPVYKTLIQSELINENFQYYIFTSPSNLEGFLKLNTIPTESKIIAWGKTTEKALIDRGFHTYLTLENSTEKELISKLSHYLH